MSDPKKPNMAQSIMGTAFTPQAQLPTIQAGWAEFELMMRGRQWPESIIEVCRQAYYSGADRLHQIITSMPMDANIVGRVHQALHTELRGFDQEMVEQREARAQLRKAGDDSGPTGP